MVMVNLGSTDDSRYTGYREITDHDVLDLQCSSFMKKRTPTKTNDINEKLKTIIWSLNRQTVFLQNLLNHVRLLFSSISDTSNNFFH